MCITLCSVVRLRIVHLPLFALPLCGTLHMKICHEYCFTSSNLSQCNDSISRKICYIVCLPNAKACVLVDSPCDFDGRESGGIGHYKLREVLSSTIA